MSDKNFFEPIVGISLGLATIGILNKAFRKPKISHDSNYQRQLAIGTRVEMEHTRDVRKARKIASDHLREFPDYYSHLLPMEAQLKREWARKQKSVNKVYISRRRGLF